VRLSHSADPADFCARLVDLGTSAAPSRFLPLEFIRVDSGLQALLASGAMARGEAQVQDEAAGLVVAVLDPQPGETVLDACAAPGGKALFSAARMKGKGRLVALDSSDARLRALAAAARTQPTGSIVECVAADLRYVGMRQLRGSTRASSAQQWPQEQQQQQQQQQDQGLGQKDQDWKLFHRVLLDAPCSGTGVLSKRADLRWRRQPEDLETLRRLQADLLDAAAAFVTPGGLLVYSTCSLEEEENSEAVAGFLSRLAGQDFQLEAVPTGLLPAECVGQDGCMRMLPHVHGTDGAFAARLRRAG
jgi:16S rRNA (cytosine967-C5)-methyltransferase